ncbi:LacI family transcriptional regulator [Motilibacter rhizosphaerae]|uniref:LacI family transcriptional regulator n=1 Tax=Motilibacter rhizosphaerae TaxID=598652 RepID=A0A4Q7NNP9_9ACTN|nr:LacI family DNA-binding transcriptional regulator [Motilibacter rhizosphaerae]RZS86855.1 LacI family transcriptional regulator [Motilibacter rhizosphaerae]
MRAAGSRATLAKVAQSAGVSVATVSKVVNGRSDVSPSTRARVQDLLKEHDYEPRRAESSGGAAIEIFFGGRLGSYSTEVLQGVLDCAAELDVDVVVTTRTKPDRSGAWARRIAASGRRAAIGVSSEFMVMELNLLSRARVPLVVIDPLNAPQAQLTSVGSTNFAGGMAATQHLLDLGHRRIGYVGGPVAAACNQARMAGYRGALEAHGVDVPRDYVRTGQFHWEDGVAGAEHLLSLPTPPTAVFAGSDEVALGVIEAARTRGLRVPDDLSVVGFDDVQVAGLGSPPLTTVRQPLSEMGSVALRTALRLAAGERPESHHVELATQLVVRQSAVALR